MYTIYGKTNCAQCEAAKRFLTSRGVEFEYKTFGVDYTMDELMELPGVTREMPQIYKDGTRVGGVPQLMQQIDSKE